MTERRDDLGLDALLAAERAADDGPDGPATERLYARVLATAALPTPPPGLEAAADVGQAATAGGTAGSTAAGGTVAAEGTAGVTAAAGAGKLWLVVSLLVAGGGVATWQATRPEPAPTPVAVHRPAPVTPAQPAPAQPASAVATPALPALPPPPVQPEPEPARPEPPARPIRRPAGKRTRPRAPRTDAALVAERALLGQVAAALGAGDGARALAGLRDHARRFPDGRLAEEGAVFRVRALQLAGRTADARAAAQRFLRRYPTSLHQATVQAALAEKAAP